MGESIIPQSPINTVAEVLENNNEFNASSTSLGGLALMSAPGTQLISKAKAPAAAADKMMSNNTTTIQAEIPNEEEHDTERLAAANNNGQDGRIIEEKESDLGEGTERRAASKMSLVNDSASIAHSSGQPGAAAEEAANEAEQEVMADLPAHATEVQPPEPDSQTHNLGTIEQ